MTYRPSRRDILKAGAITGAGMGVGLSPQFVLDALGAATPCGSLGDIQHIIILIQENRSFDHYFGRYKGVSGFDDTSPLFSQAYTAAGTGFSNPLQPFHLDTAINVPPHQGQCTNDVEHQWAGAHDSWNGGANNNWMNSHIATEPNARQAAITMGYYDRRDIPFYYALADNFTICDRYFSSVIGGTDQNRLVSMTGTLDPDGWDGGGGFFDTKVGTVASPGANLGTVTKKWRPYPQVLQDAGISWKVYGTPDSQLGDNVLRYFPQFRPAVGDVAVPGVDGPLAVNAFGSNGFPLDFALDCVTGQLPQVSWIVATLTDTEHAPAPLKWGESIVSTVLLALTQSSLWKNSVLFLTYDENGGFFDHVTPPTAPSLTPGEYFATSALSTTAKMQGTTVMGKDLTGGPIGLGVRVPALVVSPFSRNPTPTGGPLVSSDLFDHTSLLRFIETWAAGIGKPAPIVNREAASKTPGLSAWRRGVVGDLTSAINFAGGRDATVPGFLTDPAQVPNRVDPTVLTECIITGTIGTLSAQTSALPTPYPVPATNTMPNQEALTAAVKRPSGPVAGQGVCPPPTTSNPNPIATPSGPLPNTSRGYPEPLAVTVASVAGGMALAGAWWSRRVRDNGVPAAAGHVEEEHPG